MPAYSYIAQDENGKKVRGSMNAVNEAELHQLLRENKLLLISSEETTQDSFRGKRIKARSLSEFNRQVGTLVGSGVSLARALNIISQQETLKAEEADAYAELCRSVRRGNSLSRSMEDMGEVFPPLLINMYKSAEEAGNLDKVAMRMADHYDKEWRLNGKVNSATLYPKILSVLIVVVLVIIMGYVLPQFQDLFDKMESLPVPTKMLMAISDFVSSHWFLLALIALGAVIGSRVLLKIPKFRLKFDELKIHLPLIGKLVSVIYTARFARTLSSLYSSGLPLVTGLEIARHTTGNTYIDSQFDEVIASVRRGENLSDSLAKVEGLIKKLEFSVRVGEETGALDSMLESTADSLDYESEMALSKMVGYLEPALIVVMALIVGFIMIAVIVPIYSSYQSIGAGY